VRAVVSDRRGYEAITSGEISNQPELLTWSDFYPFGMVMPGRNGSAGDYRYGFQGQEMDDEIKGEGNSVNYKYRMHDPRIGRFFAVDPLAWKYPELTPYQFSSNCVIAMIELEGLESNTSGSGSLTPNEPVANTDFYNLPTPTDEANNTINQFANDRSRTSSVFPGITKLQFVTDLRAVVNDPSKLHQCNMSTDCGWTSIEYAWLSMDPEGFATFAISLYETGTASYNDFVIEADEGITDYGKVAQNGQGTFVDVVVAGSISYVEHWPNAYNPNSSDMMDMATTVEVWRVGDALGFSSTIYGMYIPGWIEGANTAENLVAGFKAYDTQIKNNNAQIILLTHYGSVNHYMVYSGGIQFTATGNVQFKAFDPSQGKIRTITLTATQFEKQTYQYIIFEKPPPQP